MTFIKVISLFCYYKDSDGKHWKGYEITCSLILFHYRFGFIPIKFVSAIPLLWLIACILKYNNTLKAITRDLFYHLFEKKK